MDKRRRVLMATKVKRHLFLLCAAASVALGLIQLATVVIGPHLEGRLFPVIDQVTITDLQNGSGCSDCISVSGHFEKLRECTFLGLLAVYQVSSGGRVGVPVRFAQGAAARDKGTHDFGPWEIDLSARQFEENTIVETFHQCHMFWVTVTRFHPPL